MTDPRLDGPTPGPWVATLDGDWWMVLTEASHAIDGEDERQLPVVDLFHGGYDYSSFNLGSLSANAHLIAAAPDLLENAYAARDTMARAADIFESIGKRDEAERLRRGADVCRAAITRARGKDHA